MNGRLDGVTANYIAQILEDKDRLRMALGNLLAALEGVQIVNGTAVTQRILQAQDVFVATRP